MISTSTSLSSSQNPVTYGSAVTFTATVTPGSGGSMLCGTVTIFADNVAIGSVSVFSMGGPGSGSLSFPACALPAGSHSLTAASSGDGAHSLSASSGLTQVVNKLAPLLNMSSSAQPSVYGQAVGFTVQILFPITGIQPPTGVVS